LDDLGILPALKWLAREVSRTSEIKVDVTADEVPDDLPEEHKTCVYRVVQEALRNTSRHAGARHARVSICFTAGTLVLSVQDDGCGFDTLRDKGLGLLGMQERVTHIGGSFQLDSVVGQGTIIGVQLPVPGQSAGRNQTMRPLRTA